MQSYTNIEIIAVNDGSTDDSLQVLDSLRQEDTRLVILNFEHNSGVTAARIKGVEYSTGEYLFFLDSDDWLDTRIIEYLVFRIINDNSDIVISGSRTTKGDKIVEERCLSDLILNREDFYFHFLNRNIAGSISTKLFKKSLWRIELSNENLMLQANEDYLILCTYVSFSFKISTISYIGYNYTYRHDSASQNMNAKKSKDCLNVTCYIKELLQNEGIYKNLESSFSSFSANQIAIAILGNKYIYRDPNFCPLFELSKSKLRDVKHFPSKFLLISYRYNIILYLALHGLYKSALLIRKFLYQYHEKMQRDTCVTKLKYNLKSLFMTIITHT